MRAKDNKYSITSAKILNLPPKARNHWANVLLASVVSSNLMKGKGGLNWVLNGRDKTGNSSAAGSYSAAG